MTRRAKRTTKKTAPRKIKRPSDTALIRECIVYAQSVAAFHKDFKADPDGSSDQAAAMGDRYNNRASQALTKIANTPAATPEGLCSKARIVEIVFEDNEGGCLEADACDFLKSFGAEVKAFLQPICDGTVKLGANTPDDRGGLEARIRAALEGGPS